MPLLLLATLNTLTFCQIRQRLLQYEIDIMLFYATKTQLKTPIRAVLAFHNLRNYYGCFYALKTLGGGLWYFNLCLYGIREQATSECESWS